MAWYWPSLDSPESAKTAVVNAVGVSALLAVWVFLTALLRVLQHSLLTGRLLLSTTVAATSVVIWAVIGWGIHRMSRTASIAGIVWWLVLFGYRIPFMILTAYRTGNPLAFILPALILLVLLLYVIALRATFAYYRHLTTTPPVGQR